MLLEVPDIDQNWHVQLEYREGRVFIEQGLQEFYTFFNIRDGSILWFQKVTNNKFHVKIGNPTGIEKNYMKYIQQTSESNLHGHDIGTFFHIHTLELSILLYSALTCILLMLLIH